jgi:hypothetical protein
MQVVPILSMRCTAACHNAEYTMAAQAYTRLEGMAGGMCAGRPRMMKGNAAMSLVYQKIAGTQNCGNGMPIAMGQHMKMPQAEIDLIKNWIDQGANNN